MTTTKFRYEPEPAAQRLVDFGRSQRRAAQSNIVVRHYRGFIRTYNNKRTFQLVVDALLLNVSLALLLAFVCIVHYIFGN